MLVKIMPDKTLRYCYRAGMMDFECSMLCEVGQHYQAAAREQREEILRKRPGFEVRTVDLARSPWCADKLVKSDPL